MFDKPVRNHISIVFERLGVMFVIVAAVGFANFREGLAEIFSRDFWRELSVTATGIEQKYYVIGAAVFLAVILLVFLVTLLVWQRTMFFIDGDSLVYKRNTIFKKESRLPVGMIATVNIERNVFERIVGTAKIKIDINSSRTANSTDFAFVLRQEEAAAFKAALTERKAAAAGIELPSERAADTRELIAAYTPAQVIRHKLLSLPIMQGVLAAAAIIPSFLAGGDGSWQTALKALAAAAVLALGTFIVSVLNSLDYRVEADRENVYISCGRLKKVSYTFSKSRVNAVFVREPFLARLVGCCGVDVAVVGLGNEKNEKPSLCLMTEKANALDIIEKCFADGYVCKAKQSRAQSRAALLPSFFGWLILCIAVGVGSAMAAAAVSPTAAFSAAAAVALTAAALIFASFKAKKIRFDENVLCYTRGIFTKQTGIFRYDRVQHLTAKTNLVMRRLGASKMSWSILSGSAMKAHSTGWFEPAVFESAAVNTVAAGDISSALFNG